MNYKYYDYLKSPEWKVKTIQIHSIYNNKCAFCQSTNNLNVHHITYRHLYYEPLGDLILLCKPCHTLIYNLFQLYIDNMNMVDGNTNSWYTNRFRHKVVDLIIESVTNREIDLNTPESIKEYWNMLSALVVVALNGHMIKHHINIKITNLPSVIAELTKRLSDSN